MASIYALLDVDGNVRYIGKANDPHKRLKGHVLEAKRKNTPLAAWIMANGTPSMVVLEADCADWQEAEKRLIAEHRIKGCDLLNVAPGGNQPFCPYNVRAMNGSANARSRVDTPRKKRIYELRRNLGGALQRGEVSDAVKLKMKALAFKRPDTFAEWKRL